MVGERADSATIARLRAELRLDDPLPVAVRPLRRPASRRATSAGRTSPTGRSRRTSASAFPRRCSSPARRCCSRPSRHHARRAERAQSRRPRSTGSRSRSRTSASSFPVYWVGLLLILLFAVTLHWLPPSGFGGLRFLVLPALTLGMRSIAFLARMTRSAMLDALGADYVRTARAKGLRERVVTSRARAAQRAHPDHHRARSRLRRVSHRQHSHRDDLLVARASAATS